MVRSSTYKDEQYDVYEVYVESAHAVDAGEAGANAIVISGVEAHAVVIANEEYARAYADGALTTVASVTFATGDTTVNFSSLTEGEIIDIYFPVTGTGCGSLMSNTNTGKLTLPRMQNIQNWNVASNLEQVPECGTERKEPIEFAADGTITLGLNRHGNMAMADFIAARKGKSSGDEIYLLVDVTDTTVALATHDLLLEAKVESYERMSRAVDSIQGIITDTVTLSFVPDVVTFDET